MVRCMDLSGPVYGPQWSSVWTEVVLQEDLGALAEGPQWSGEWTSMGQCMDLCGPGCRPWWSGERILMVKETSVLLYKDFAVPLWGHWCLISCIDAVHLSGARIGSLWNDSY